MARQLDSPMAASYLISKLLGAEEGASHSLIRICTPGQLQRCVYWRQVAAAAVVAAALCGAPRCSAATGKLV